MDHGRPGGVETTTSQLSEPGRLARLGHQPALDGLRGVAVLVVLGHNLGWPWLRGGFFGVDLFFALSGFLITTLLLEEYARQGTISLRRFFVRRALRLYPALVVVVLFSGLSVLLLKPEVTGPRVVLMLGSTLLYFSNYVLAADTQAWAGGLAHTWSLAVEVHFYLAWAFLVAFLTGRRGLDLRVILRLTLGLATAGAVWRLAYWWVAGDADRVYASTGTRIDALFWGATAGVLRLRLPGDLAGQGGWRVGRATVQGIEWGCAVGVLVLVGAVRQGSWVASAGGYGLVAAAGAALILTTLLSEHSWLSGVLSRPVLRWFGEISYSLYLWHLPASRLFTAERLTRWGCPDVLVEATRAGLCVLLAAGSYYTVERYFLRRKLRWA